MRELQCDKLSNRTCDNYDAINILIERVTYNVIHLAIEQVITQETYCVSWRKAVHAGFINNYNIDMPIRPVNCRHPNCTNCVNRNEIGNLIIV